MIDTGSTAEGYVLAGETRLRVRATDSGYAEQGGAEAGCGSTRSAGRDSKTNTIRVVALNVMTVDVGATGSLAIWPANRSEPRSVR